MDEKPKINSLTIGIVVLIPVLIGAGIWYWQSKNTALAPIVTTPATTVPCTNTTSTAEVPVTQEAGGSIGAKIFEKTQNPVTNKLPETNPLKSIIKNPF